MTIKPADFAEVLAEELDQIDERRQRLGLSDPLSDRDRLPADPSLEHAEQRAGDRRLVGLAFSGGGIRSATFNLGVLQGLARLGLLRFVDYLSTVSGGGYIGAWLVGWVRREGGLAPVERQLATNRGERPPPDSVSWKEPEPISHLRRYSNYLAPRLGFLSADLWVLLASYLRNFLLCQAVLLPAVVAVLLISRLAMVSYHPYHLEGKMWEQPPASYFLVIGILAALFWLASFVLLLRAAGKVRERAPVPAAPPGPERRIAERGMGVIAGLMALSAALFCWFGPYELPFLDRAGARLGLASELPWWDECAIFAAGGGTLAALGYLIALITSRPEHRAGSPSRAVQWAVTAGTGILTGALLYGAYRLLHGLYLWDGTLPRDYLQAQATARLTTFGPPAVLLTLTLGFYLAVGLLGRRMREELREWWSSLCGRLLVAAALWLSVNLVALYGTALVLWAGPWARAALSSGWLLTVGAGVLAGQGPRTPATGPKNTPQEWLAHLAPPLFVAGLLVAVSLLIHWALDNPPLWEKASDAVWYREIVPEHPPIRVTETTSRKPEESPVRERTDVVARDEVIDAGDVVQQMYWVGMLNTKPELIPSEEYRLSEWDIERLKTDWDLKRLKADKVSEEVLKKITPLQELTQHEPMQREEFLKALDKFLPPNTPYSHRVAIIRYAKVVRAMEFSRGLLLLKLFLALFVCVGLATLAAWRVDVNLFSLHALYGNRLVRAYLGASRPMPPEADGRRAPLPGERSPDPVTKLDPDDDLRLARLRIGTGAAETSERGVYDGPYLIVNTALNLVRGDRLDWQERKAESFVLTPMYCGSANTGYRPTAEGYGGDVRLGTAITVSGAAASPNMGYHSSPAVTALLTVFNARLGAWLGNPASPTRWRSGGPSLGFFHLFRELFGATREKGGYVYLSDGGHFENLGAYELVRRRCRYVILVDAGRDGAHAFEDLGNLIRKCRTDFGIRIQIDLGSLRRDDKRRCHWHCAVGQIRYDDVDPQSAPGTLLYLKPSLTGDEPADVAHYAESHPDFPHETTGDQFFSESQFESYRALGEHIAEAVFAPSVDDMREKEPNEKLHRQRCRELFSSIVRRWFSLPPEYEASFIHSTDGYLAIQEQLRADPRLWRLSLDLYPELAAAGAGVFEESALDRAARRTAEVHLITQMCQVMENAWLSLNLEVHYAHPLNRGWLDVFHRWTSAETLREHWPVLRAEFARGFVDFCEKQMRMGTVEGRAVPLTGDKVPPPLAREFHDEWPLSPELERQVHAAQIDGERLAWLVYPSGPYPTLPQTAGAGAPAPANAGTPCGIILASPDGHSGERIYDLFVWIRGAYRNTGLGRTAVRDVIAELERTLAAPFWLRVRLPKEGLSGPGGKLQRGMWLTFFFHHEFVRDRPERGDPEAGEVEETELVLERVFPERK